MRKQNFNSDFDFVLDLCDNQGVSVGAPDINWELLLLTAGSRQLTYTASHQYGENRNCVIDGDTIRIMVDRHKLPVGELLYELTVEIPDKSFPDGSRKVFVDGSTDIEIVSETGQQVTDAVVKVNVPHLKKAEEPTSPEPEPSTSESEA